MVSRKAYLAAAELARRNNDGLAMFRALETQLPVFKSEASELLVRGGNRSGKSVSGAVKFAAVARDKPIFDKFKTPMVQRLPWQKDRPLLMWCVGLQWDHIGDTLYRLLFKPGLYRIIRDKATFEWRAFDPIKDVGRDLEAKPSFPLIPMSEVKGGLSGISWETKKERQFNRVELHNGTVIRAWASTGEVKQGDPVDYIWIDEEISIIGHYAEWQARLSDTKGRIVWSSLSQANPALMSITNRAAEQKREVNIGHRKCVDVEEYVLRFSQNPHIDKDEKRKRLEGWDEDNRRMRDEGDYIIGNLKVYPSFDRNVHRAVYDDSRQDDKVSKILRERKGVPPHDWTRDLILDPGTAKPGVLFGAIPPPEMWLGKEPFFVIYDEIYIPRLTAVQIAERVYNKSKGYAFQRFVIDGQAARQTPMGFAGTIGGNYTKEFRLKNLVCQESGSTFVPGDPNFPTRSQLVDSALSHRPCGTPQLRIVTERCPELVAQMEGNLKAIQRGPNGETIVLDKPAAGQKDDLRVCVEYWLSRYPTYEQPPKVVVQPGGVGMSAYKAIQKMFGPKQEEPNTVHIGPGAAA